MEQTEDTNRIRQDSNWMERFYNTKKQTEQQPQQGSLKTWMGNLKV